MYIPPWHLDILALGLVILAGLDAPLAALALLLLAYNNLIVLRAEFTAFNTGYSLFACTGLAVIQVLLNLYFLPIRVRDRRYLAPQRTAGAHIHARFQSLFRPLAGALVIAALPTGLPAQPVAVAGFVGATATYWFSAWIREYVAIGRGALVMMLLETLKHMVLFVVVALLLWSPTIALLWLLATLFPVTLWTARLQRETVQLRAAADGSGHDDA